MPEAISQVNPAPQRIILQIRPFLHFNSIKAAPHAVSPQAGLEWNGQIASLLLAGEPGQDPGEGINCHVLNGCRSEFRRRRTSRNQPPDIPVWSAESAALATEERLEVMRALNRLPARQREALVLRYYLDLSEAETASAMRISRGTAKSTAARGLASLRQLLGEGS